MQYPLKFLRILLGQNQLLEYEKIQRNYILLLSFILHLSIFNPLSHRTINQKLSEKKKYLILLLICIYLFRFCQYIFNYVYDNGSVCVFLSCYNIIAVFALILTIFLITEQKSSMLMTLLKCLANSE